MLICIGFTSCKKKQLDIELINERVLSHADFPEMFKEFDPEEYCSLYVELQIKNISYDTIYIKSYPNKFFDPQFIKVKYTGRRDFVIESINHGFVKERIPPRHIISIAPNEIDTIYHCDLESNKHIEKVRYQLEYQHNGELNSQIL